MAVNLERTKPSDAHEPLSRDYFNNLVNFIGNHEAKLYVAAVLASSPETVRTGYFLREEIREKQEPYPGWTPDEKTLSDYCSSDFAEIGVVEPRTGIGRNNKFTTGYRAVPSEAELLLGFSGIGLQWSLNHPDMSLQVVLGRTRSEGEFRSPQTRLDILRGLLDGPAAGMGTTEVREALTKTGYDRLPRIYRHLGSLSSMGVLSELPGNKYEINDQYLIATLELSEGLKDFIADPYNPEWQSQAIAIIEDHEKSAAIMKKAETFSTQTD